MCGVKNKPLNGGLTFFGLGLAGAFHPINRAQDGGEGENRAQAKAAAAGEFDKDQGTPLVEVLAPDKSDTAGWRESVSIVGNSKPRELGVKLGKGMRGW